MLLIDKRILFWVILVVLVITAFFTLYFQRNSGYTYKRGENSPEFDKAVGVALDVYKREAAGMNLSSGPCLTNDLIPGWVADIVHNPRQDVDDLSQNQCPAYLEGRAKHFVELDLNGNVIRVK